MVTTPTFPCVVTRPAGQFWNLGSHTFLALPSPGNCCGVAVGQVQPLSSRKTTCRGCLGAVLRARCRGDSTGLASQAHSSWKGAAPLASAGQEEVSLIGAHSPSGHYRILGSPGAAERPALGHTCLASLRASRKHPQLPLAGFPGLTNESHAVF